ncbi:ribonuclease E inhibitor RraB [Asticcacaulis tiandongensis]|uniref:ribonuclease E inhibitor RraB n=1 Tax=Asticcacaulis tiandongensis TaxID=2565365 RepID=UPI001128AB6A|nr:ribonuclease E inhibitor RraB [Asticcacaulis tiandongensis]
MSEFPEDENGIVLRRMKESGDDLSLKRTINFSVVFYTHINADIFCNKFSPYADSMHINYTEMGSLPIWDVTVDKYMLPSYDEITCFELKIAEFATPLNGHNDGWGCFQK